MRYTKKIRRGMRDEIILLGPGYAVFNGRDAIVLNSMAG